MKNTNNKDESPRRFDEAESKILALFFADDIWKQNGSDYYIDPHKTKAYTLRVRIDGWLKEIEQPKLQENNVKDFLVLAGFNNTEPLADSLDLTDCSFLPDAVKAKWHLTALPTLSGVSLTLRRMGEPRVFNFDQIGFLPEQISLIKNVLSELDYGLIVVTGHTGNGKTNTINAIADEMWLDKRVFELGDPIEIQNDNRTQLEIGNFRTDSDKTNGRRAAFGTAVRASADVIIYPDIRSKEEFLYVIDIALQGQIVLITLHGDNVTHALERLLSYDYTDLLADALKLVIGQRLERMEVFPDAIKKARGDQFETSRMAIFEVLAINEPLRSHLRKTAHPGKLVKLAQDKDGFLSRRDVVETYEQRGAVFARKPALEVD